MNQFTQEEAEQYITGGLHVLAHTGCLVEHPVLVDAAEQAGADVRRDTGRVFFPEDVLRGLLGHVPSEYYIANLKGEQHPVGIGHPPVGTAIVTDPWIIDYGTGKPRHPVLDDIRIHSTIAQKMDSVHAASLMEFPVADYPGESSFLHALETYLNYHAKHYVVMPADMKRFYDWLEIAEILLDGADIAGSNLLSVGVAVKSPLTLNRLNCELLIECSNYGFPVIPTICPMAGTTAPYSKAGTLLLGIAENLMVAALLQCVRHGTPFLFTFGPSVSDMRTGEDRYYTLDKVLWKYAAVQAAQILKIPSAAECGGSMSGMYDIRAGADTVLFMQAAYDSGASCLSGFGSFMNAMGMSGEMMIIQDAWLDALRFFEKGIDVDGLPRALQSIDEAGPGGNFLTDSLTLENLRSKEFFANPLFDTNADGLSLLEKAHIAYEHIAAETREPVIPPGIAAHLKKWFECKYK